MMVRPEAPAPLSRRGPRPLMLHLNLAWLRSSGLIGESLNLSGNWLNMPPPGAAPPDPEALRQALGRATEGDRALIAGIAAYRRFPYTRRMEEPPCLWAEEETRLLDYGGAGPSVLFVPSLINRAYILDLMPEASMLRWLAAHGARPLLLDWGWPGPVERGFTLTDYIAGRLERALAAIDGPVVLAGYCMGGLLALAAALRQPQGGEPNQAGRPNRAGRPNKVQALALLATPWDFQAADPAAAKRLAETLPVLETVMRLTGTLPIDLLQTLFTMIDPFGVAEKYRGFAALDPASLRARRFVAMEDWLADGVPLAAPVARETIGGWYGANATARGAWRVAGLAVAAERLAVPVFCAIPARDRLVPPESARPLAALLAHATVIEPQAGHIGMIAGAHAEMELWKPFAEWLQALCKP